MEKQTATEKAATAELYIIDDPQDERAFIDEIVRRGPTGVYIYDAIKEVEEAGGCCEEAYAVSHFPLNPEGVLNLCAAEFAEEPEEEQFELNESVAEYWYKHYLGDESCSLCAGGVLDTRRITAGGGRCGKLNWCICPNGQAKRFHAGNTLPGDVA